METPVPPFSGSLNKDLILYKTELFLVIEKCNADKASIKKIQDKTK